MTEWIVDGKRYSIAEYEVYRKQKLEEQKLAQEETWRLIDVLGEAYTACDKFMEEHPSSPYGVKDEARRAVAACVIAEHTEV